MDNDVVVYQKLNDDNLHKDIEIEKLVKNDI